MQIHQLKRKHQNKKSRQVGRGGKRGKTSGRGTKGQKARAGHKIRPQLRDEIKKIPKLRGRGVNANRSIVVKPRAINLVDLEAAFASGDAITLETLVQKGLVNRGEKVKILGTGDLSKKLTITGFKVSASAKEKIEKAGGTVVSA